MPRDSRSEVLEWSIEESALVGEDHGRSESEKAPSKRVYLGKWPRKSTLLVQKEWEDEDSLDFEVEVECKHLIHLLEHLSEDLPLVHSGSENRRVSWRERSWTRLREELREWSSREDRKLVLWRLALDNREVPLSECKSKGVE